MKECFGRYNLKDEKCLKCSQRIKCMLRKFDKPQFLGEWSDFEIEPSCFGSYTGKEKCQDCPFIKDCVEVSKNIKRESLRKGKKIRLTGKYKGRGKWKPKNIY